MKETPLTIKFIEGQGFVFTNEYQDPCYILKRNLLIEFGSNWQLACDYGEPGSYRTVVNSEEQLIYELKRIR